MAKRGTDYELFVKDVYECLNRADGLSNVETLHDVKLAGAAGVEHQIDIYWSFKFGGVEYKAVVECKDYNSHVSKEKIQSFHSVLNDLGNVHGIFASRLGFQSGAISYAEKYGIQLMEIRHPIEADWDGKMKNIHIELITQTIGDVHPQIIVNKQRAEEMDIPLPKEKGFYSRSDSILISYDKMTVGDKNYSVEEKSMLDLIKIIQTLDSEAGKGKKLRFSFENGMITLDGMELPIDAIVFTYDIREHKDDIHINGDDVIRAIVKNITEKTEIHIDRFGRVSEITKSDFNLDCYF